MQIMTNDRIEYLLNCQSYTFPLLVEDHWGGVDQDFTNPILDRVAGFARSTGQKGMVIVDSPWQTRLAEAYPDLDFRYRHVREIWDSFYDYNQHPDHDYQNFVCSLNGWPTVERRLLMGALHRMGWFDRAYSTKNFAFEWDQIWGDVNRYCDHDDAVVYSKFFQGNNSFNHEVFGVDYNTVMPADSPHANDIIRNLHALDRRLTQSFVQVSAETTGMKYHPFYTEKFLFSIVTRGLFVFFAQPGWHQGLVDFYGFRLYDKVFDYDFDQEINPIKRMTKLICMLSRFSRLNRDDWRDLYLMQQTEIEYNYDRYFSRDWLSGIEIHCYG